MLGGGINIWIAAVALFPHNDNIDPVPFPRAAPSPGMTRYSAGTTIVETITFRVDHRTKFVLESLKE
jgi:hypothetical protein